MVATIHARGLLKVINWDFERMLDDDKIPCDKIIRTLKKRINRIENNNYQVVDWR